MKIQTNIILFLGIFVIIFYGCGKRSENFTLEDFKSTDKIDGHVHYAIEKTYFMEQTIDDNFRLFTIDTDAEEFIDINEQERIALLHKNAHPGKISYATTFKMEGWDNPDWVDKTIVNLDNSISKGAIAVKVWKNIGMTFKDKNGKFIMIDDPKFYPIFKHLTEKGIPLVGHIGEPKNCWLPLEEMTVNNDRDYFSKHPEFHMYLHPEYPSYETIVTARDNMLRKNPDLHFIGCHLASYEWSIEVLGKFFDEFPNSAVDLAHRIGHMQYLALKDYENVRNFFIKYQDRFIYGSDTLPDGTENPDEFKKNLHETWLRDWRYFSTGDIMTSPYLNEEFKGLGLPKTVVEKIFRINAQKWYPGI